MSLLQSLGLATFAPADLRQWAVVTETDWTAGLVQTGRDRIALIRLRDGRFACNANILTEETGMLAGRFDDLPASLAQCTPLVVCRSLLDVPDAAPEEGASWPEWVQILGAGLGPQGAEDGWPVGARVIRDGLVRVSRVPNNANEPLTDAPSTWSRADGRYVVPAGWQYQPGEDVTEDGETWHRVTQATSFRPSESPAQWVQITGPGGEPVTAPDAVPAWEPWDGIRTPYTTGDRVTHNGATWESTTASNTWEPGVFGWVEVADDDSQWDEGPVPVNINTADAETLAERLPGVGASLAQSIIDGRPWADPGDLAQIGGISEAMVEDWMDDPGLEVE